MRNFKKLKDRKQLKNSCGKGKRGCNYDGEATLKTKIKIAA